MTEWEADTMIRSNSIALGHVDHSVSFAGDPEHLIHETIALSVPTMNGKNPIRDMSLMPHMLSAGKEPIPEQMLIFELGGNIGLRKGPYKLWSKIKSNKADWKEHVTELERTDLELFDLSTDIAEQKELALRLDAFPITHWTKDDPSIYLYYAGPNEPVDEKTVFGTWVHHPIFGIKLREAMYYE
jgi:hypothetical protein